MSRLVESFPNLKVWRCDGTDFLASYRTMGEAVDWVRRERKPAFVHAKVIRPYSHSLSDDERLYKTPEEREAEARRDPITRMRQFLLSEGLATEADIQAIAADVDREIADATNARTGVAEARHRDRGLVCVFARRRSDIHRVRHRSRASRASPTRWSRPSIARSRTRWRSTRASSSSARTLPTRAKRNRCRMCPARAASSR